MGTKIHDFGSGYWCFHCPGCGRDHPFVVPRWSWNGSLDKPTFSPSLIVDRGTPRQCHVIVTDGKIQFCSDCFHSLAGKIVEMPDWDEEKKMAFDFGKPSPATPSSPSTGAPKAPGGFDFGPQYKPASAAPATGVSAATVAPRCANCGATMARILVPANLPTHAPRPPEFSCPKCGYRTPY